jgi:hypothetical protein
MRASWKLSLQSANESDNTIAVYISALQRFEEYLAEHDVSTRLD